MRNGHKERENEYEDDRWSLSGHKDPSTAGFVVVQESSKLEYEL